MKPKRRFDNIKTGIEFYMLVNQFLRVAYKIEQAHDTKLKERLTEDDKNLKETLKYYQDEKEILIGRMFSCLAHTSLVLEEEEKKTEEIEPYSIKEKND